MVEIDYQKVGQKMKQLRSSMGITQDRVANDLGCTVAFVSNVEHNRAKLNLRVITYYAQLCNVSVDSLLAAGMKEPVLTDHDQWLDSQMLDAFHKFSEDDRAKIIKTLKIWKNK